jgi:hypothetical protein
MKKKPEVVEIDKVLTILSEKLNKAVNNKERQEIMTKVDSALDERNRLTKND